MRFLLDTTLYNFYETVRPQKAAKSKKKKVTIIQKVPNLACVQKISIPTFRADCLRA